MCPSRGRESGHGDPTPMQRPRAAAGWGPPLRPLPRGGGSGLSGVTTPVASLLEVGPPWDGRTWAQGRDCFVRRFWRTKLVPSIHNLGACSWKSRLLAFPRKCQVQGLSSHTATSPGGLLCPIHPARPWEPSTAARTGGEKRFRGQSSRRRAAPGPGGVCGRGPWT